jgi:hypothetical protein
MRIMPLTLLAAMVLLPLGHAAAQDPVLENVLTACEDDFEQYCSQVTPGDGRLMFCAAAHEDKLSGECSYALYQAASYLEQLATAIAYVASECRTDIETLCAGVMAGEGRILSCLADNASQVSDSCKEAVDAVAGE